MGWRRRAATGWRRRAATRRRRRAATRRRATTTHIALNPAEHVVRASPDTRMDFLCATPSPRGRTVDAPSAAGLAHQGAATVALAGINDPLRIPPLCAEHVILDLIARIIAGHALRLAHHIDLRLLQHIWRPP